MSWAARVPLRQRLTLTFVAATTLVLIALGLFLHARLRSELDASLDRGLRQRAADVSALAVAAAPRLGSSRLIERGDDLAQVLTAEGQVVAGAPGFERRPLLTSAEARRARDGILTIAHRDLRDRGYPDDDQVRLLAAPADGRVVVVGADVESRDGALRSLDRILYLGIPVAVLLAGLIGFVVAGRALAPVERLRRRAASIEAGDLGERLPVAPADDEVRALAETLNAMLARLDAAFSRERAFVADASHELRTPLATLKAELELAGRPGRRLSELEAAVASAAQETDRLVRLAEDLLVIARADQAGGLPVARAPLDVLALLQHVAARAGGPVTVHAEPGIVLDADRLRLEQALANLLDNAHRHGRAPVTLSATRVGEAVELHVTDAGPGVPDGFAAHAFERFTRGDEARARGGAGLGLPIVAAIAVAHGGQAGLTETDRGLDAWIALPAPASASAPGDPTRVA